MPIRFRLLSSPSLSLSLLLIQVLASAAQTKTGDLSPDLEFRIKATLLSQVGLPAGAALSFSGRTVSELPGYDSLLVHYRVPTGSSGTLQLLISKDNTKVAQFTTYDITLDPKAKVAAADGPGRGGPPGAPVQVVGYDDLECPFCSLLHAELFPALLERYGNQVRFVYRNFPLDGHPWATRAAEDTNCLGRQSEAAYWAAIDTIHSHFADYGGAEHSKIRAEEEIGVEVRRQGEAFHVNMSDLDTCLSKHDPSEVLQSVHQGERLGVDSTPTLFINGLKVRGAQPLAYIFSTIDDALRAEGKTPPPPFVVPSVAK